MRASRGAGKLPTALLAVMRGGCALVGPLALALMLGSAGAAVPSRAGVEEVDLEALSAGVDTPAPTGWVRFCQQRPAHCLEGGAPARLRLDRQAQDLLQRTQRKVNRPIRQIAEARGRDRWEFATTRGDCEDFALVKRSHLLAAGMPAGAIRLATAFTEQGDFHAVLTVATDRGTMVLDNRFKAVKPWRALDYQWVSVERPEDPLRWLLLDPARVAGGP